MAPLNIGRFGSGPCEGQTFPVGAPPDPLGLSEASELMVGLWTAVLTNFDG